ncbi:MAG: ABC transporter ATP-binding protein [Chloroflexi bacterium]|nr:ABC transporter ATP-binding protein [Chloroflexota bacterium]
MGFVMDGLDADAYDREYSDRALLRRIINYFRPQTRPMLIVALAVFVGSLTDTAVPILISRGIDLVIANPATQVMVLLITSILLLSSVSWGLNFLRQWLGATAIGNVTLKIREDAFNATMGHDLSFFDDQPTGKLVSRVSSDTDGFAETVSLTMNLISQAMLVLLMGGVLLFINFQLGLITLAMAPFVAAISLLFRRIARETSLHSRRIMARVNAHIEESISGIAVAKVFRQEKAVHDDFVRINEQAYRVNFRQGIVLNTFFPVFNATAGIGTAVIVYFGGLNTASGTMSVGDWYLFIQALMFFWFPLTQIASFWSQFQNGLSASERVFGLIDAESRVVQTDDISAENVQGGFEFRNVNFSYLPTETVLPDFNLTIHAGESLALVGHTGSGKTSIVRLVARFYEFQEGQLLVDGRDIRTFNLPSYRRQIGIVPQSPFLFSGTVGENVRYGKPDANEADVLRAVEHIAGGDWLADLPNGLESDVGERGGRLSMGQRQLVALARVMLHDPAVFILDEATASVDPFTEVQIQDGIEAIMRDRTSIVIAHRLYTVQHADRILVLDSGRILEEGTHQTLLAAGGHYAGLYDTYFRHQSLEYVESVEH